MLRRTALRSLVGPLLGTFSGCNMLHLGQQKKSELTASFRWIGSECGDGDARAKAKWDDSTVNVEGTAVLPKGCYTVDTVIHGPSEESRGILVLTFTSTSAQAHCIDCDSRVNYTTTIEQINTSIDEVRVIHSTPDREHVVGTYAKESTA